MSAIPQIVFLGVRDETIRFYLLYCTKADDILGVGQTYLV